MNGKLFLVSVPIGNPEDITLRAVATFKSSDIIAAENPAVSARLFKSLSLEDQACKLAAFAACGTSQKLARRAADTYPVMSASDVISRLKDGLAVALISDAGTPVIADPGYNLISECYKNGIKCIPVPGASAMTAAIAASGIYSGRFCFEGFLSVNNNSRRERLSELKAEKRPIILYEAPKKLPKTVRDLLNTLGDRSISVSRNLTKPDEEIFLTTLKSYYNKLKASSARVDGEYVLIIGPDSKTC